jgi:hypothetical protein
MQQRAVQSPCVVNNRHVELKKRPPMAISATDAFGT